MSLRDLADRLPHPLLRTLPVPGLGERHVLEIDLARGVAESPPDSPVEAVRQRHTPTVRALVDGLDRASRDERVAALLVHAGTSPLTLAQAGELRTAIRRFAEAGKPTVAWAETYGEMSSGTLGYHVATACAEVWLQPTGDLALVGVAAEVPLLRGALDKLAITPQLERRHDYKSAAERFTHAEMSEANRTMTERLLASATEVVTTEVAEARGLTRAQVSDAVDRAPLTAEQAQEAGLVDRLGYRRAVLEALATQLSSEAAGTAPPLPELRYVERYRTALPGVGALRRGRPTVGIIRAAGPIHLGRSGGGSPLAGRSVGADTLGAALRQAREDDDVRAVVLRVDSPGGSYVASDAIRDEVRALRDAGKPVVASMASVAGSGGYYVAMPCNEVLAQPGTLTGSIGVLAGKLVISEALARVGVNREIVKSGPQADTFSTQRPFTDDELARLSEWLDRVYADFTRKAAADRGMAEDELEAVARGRVWTGVDAHERGLVDRLGGLTEAVSTVCDHAGLDLDRVQVRSMPRVGPLDRLMPAESSDSPVAAGVLGEGLALPDRALAALGLQPWGILTMPPLPRLS